MYNVATVNNNFLYNNELDAWVTFGNLAACGYDCVIMYNDRLLAIANNHNVRYSINENFFKELVDAIITITVNNMPEAIIAFGNSRIACGHNENNVFVCYIKDYGKFQKM